MNSTPIELPEEYRQNLLKLADYLSRFCETPERQFDMTEFDEVRHRCSTQGQVLDCGSVGCAIGHGPYAGIPKHDDENWFDYALRVFLPGPQGSRVGYLAWDWCFSIAWARTDNSPGGAAARIRWLLEYGVPDDADAQMDREAQLCYVTETEVE